MGNRALVRPDPSVVSKGKIEIGRDLIAHSVTTREEDRLACQAEHASGQFRHRIRSDSEAKHGLAAGVTVGPPPGSDVVARNARRHNPRCSAINTGVCC
jgi:hypothetical protein